MKGGDYLDNALLVSCEEKGTRFFTEQLGAASVKHIAVSSSCSDARRKVLEHDYDIVVINAPLKDETGEALARNIAVKGAAQVILVVKNEFFDAVSAACENDGVLTVSKPLNRSLFWATLTLAKAAISRVKRVQNENRKLKQKIEDIRIVDRAKWVLVSYVNMSEQEAHRHIEKQAMDMRTTKREIAEGILKSYEN